MHLVKADSKSFQVEKPSVMNRRQRRQSRWLRVVEALVAMFDGTWMGRQGPGLRRLEIVETLSIGPKKQLLLIRCDSEKYLIATGPDNVQTILRVGQQMQAIGKRNTTAELGERS